MWVDAQGVCHTVALPDPTELMSDAFRVSLDRLIGEQADEVSDLLSAEEERFYREQLAGPRSDVRESSFEGISPPSGLLGTPVETVDELRSCILAIDRRWRLDVVVALDDYLP